MGMSFRGLGIAPNILTVLDRLQFVVPTPIQERSIPQAIEGKDLIGVAQTGTGKTLAFGIPLIQGILKDPNAKALILLPTRELALQVEEALHAIAGPLLVRSVVLIGGESMGKQLHGLARRPHIVIATPGRLIDHLEQKTMTLNGVTMLVLDEADRMLDMGFAPQLKRILTVLPKERQTMLFSATMPEGIVAMARAYLKLPVRVEVAQSGTAATNVTQELFIVTQPEKPRLLEKVLQEYRGSVLVFARTKHGAKKIAMSIRSLGHTAVEMHSNRSLAQRKEALAGFKNGRYRVLVATDIAARGIDVSNIELVVNYDLPSVAEDYVHRIGRTGRAGGSGHAISFAQPDQKRDVYDIERLMHATLAVTRTPELPPAREQARVYDNDFSSRRPRTSTSRYPARNAPSRSPSPRPGYGGARKPSGAAGSRPPHRYSGPKSPYRPGGRRTGA
jgi:ATP-dependent RNA helicase RhlE